MRGAANFPGVMSSAASAAVRWIAPFLTVAAVLGVGLVSSPVPAPPVRLAADGNPLAGMPFYVNPNSKAMRAANGAGSPELTAIANTPTAYWMDHLSTPAVDAKYIADAQAAGTMPILALYALPHRDCGSFAAGGFGSAGAYRGWIDTVAADIGGGPAAVILEPDALAMADCLSGDQRQERFDLMSYAVDTLTRNPGTAVYVDAGHSRWVSADEMARPAEPGRCRQGEGIQPQYRELLHHRRGDRLRRRHLRHDGWQALRHRHLTQRRRTRRG